MFRYRCQSVKKPLKIICTIRWKFHQSVTFTNTTTFNPSLRTDSSSSTPPLVTTICLPPLPKYCNDRLHPSLSTDGLASPNKMVHKLVQKMVQNIAGPMVQSTFYPIQIFVGNLSSVFNYFHLSWSQSQKIDHTDGKCWMSFVLKKLQIACSVILSQNTKGRMIIFKHWIKIELKR